MEFAKMKKQLLQLQEKDYQNFVKALVSIETKCDDEEKLKDMYEDFMEDDTMGLLDIAPEENFPELTSDLTMAKRTSQTALHTAVSLVMYLSIFHFYIIIHNQTRGKNEITVCNIYGTIQI